jgi:LytR cell envelope-related transcriptional attenuator
MTRTRGIVALALTAAVLTASACATGAGDGGGSLETPAPTSTPRPVCSGVPVDLSFPTDRSHVRVYVYNASGVTGTAERAATALARFDYRITGVSQYPDGEVPEVAVLRYGPSAVGAAWLLKSNFPQPVRLEFDANRNHDTVDVIVGRAFVELNTITEVNQAVAAAGRPTAPPGTCDRNGGPDGPAPKPRVASQRS